MGKAEQSGGSSGSRIRRAVWGPASTRLRGSALREPAIRAYRAAARIALVGPPPKVFANSVPKAGTHLMTQLLGEVPKLWFNGMHVTRADFGSNPKLTPADDLTEFLAHFGDRMRRVRNGQFLTAHMRAFPGVGDVLEQQGFVHLLMIRDPRDIVVSRAFYRAKNERLATQQVFAELPPEQRLNAAITGLPARDGVPALIPINERFDDYRAWLDDPRVLVVRFEDLVDSAAGGSDERQHATIRRVLDACNRPSDDDTISRIAPRIRAKHSATFRRGAIGDWRNHLTGEHLDLLEQVAPGAVAAFGYAADPDVLNG